MAEYKQEDLEMVQRRSLDILLAIDKICKNHNIEYFLVAGSALGAIRHNGFIPWDDDIDIAMRYQDFLTFKKYSSELQRPYRYMDHESNHEWTNLFAKVEDASTVFETEHTFYHNYQYGVSVDIFPFFNEPENDVIRNEWLNSIHSMLVILDRKVHPRVYPLQSSLKIKFKNIIRFMYSKMILKFINYDAIWERINSLSLKYSTEDTGIYGCNESYFCIRKSELYPIKRVQFEKYKLPVPKDCEMYLRRHYGNDYMIEPPINKRHNHAPLKLEIGK